MPVMPVANKSMFEGASPKLTFTMGILVGVAGVSLLGFILAGSYLFSGKDLGKLAGGTTPPPAAPSAPQAPSAPSKVDIALKTTDYVRGNPNAPVTIIEYSDLECPFCKRFHPSMQQVMSQFGDKVRWVYRHYPLDITCNTAMSQQLHPNACLAAYTAECVGKLAGGGKFWDFVDKMLGDETAPDRAKLIAAAKSLGLNEGRLTSCMDSSEIADKVQVDLREGNSYGVNGTPTSFVNGTPVEGAVPFDQLKAIVEAALQ